VDLYFIILKKRRQKLTLRVKQKTTINKIVAISFCSTLALVGGILLFNFLNSENAKANQGEIIQVQEQVFSNDWCLSAPQIRAAHAPSPNSIQVQSIKTTPETNN
jgi:hypothetical protein